MTPRPQQDATAKNSTERFELIRKYFLENLKLDGRPRAELYNRAKPGEAREPTEEELARRWAERLDVAVNDIFIGISRAFADGVQRHVVVYSFRQCLGAIEGRVKELRYSRESLGRRSRR